jgi:hypothetical protein
VKGDEGVISARALSGAKTLRWSAALLLAGGPLLGLLSGSLGMAALAFGFGAVHLGLGQLLASENRGGRLIGIALMLGGVSAVVDAAIWMLSSAEF